MSLVINSISKRSFDSDVEIGAPRKGGPPGYMSVQFHTKMAKLNHLYKLSVDGLIIGAAILFIDGDKLNIGRIFISPDYHRKGYGIYMMTEIEKMFPAVKEIYLDTPVWNIRTNSFIQSKDTLNIRETASLYIILKHYNNLCIDYFCSVCNFLFGFVDRLVRNRVGECRAPMRRLSGILPLHGAAHKRKHTSTDMLPYVVRRGSCVFKIPFLLYHTPAESVLSVFRNIDPFFASC